MLSNGFINTKCQKPRLVVFVILIFLGSTVSGLAQSSGRFAPPRRLAAASPEGQALPLAGPNRPNPPRSAPIYPVLDFPPQNGGNSQGASPAAPFILRSATPFDRDIRVNPAAASNRAASGRTASGRTGITMQSEAVLAQENVPRRGGNLQFSVSENFLNRIVARNETTPGEVRDFILGAQVSGHQTTATRVRLDLHPAPKTLFASLILNGTTQSETTGVTRQAMVDVASQQEFVASKEVFFDMVRFSTRHAVVFVRARNQTLGAMTPLTGTPLGAIANRIAYREAERRRPQSEAIARERVAERVFPEFDRAIDQQLASLNEQWDEKVLKWLKGADLLPTEQQVWTTETSLHYSAQFSADSPSPTLGWQDARAGDGAGVHVRVHETLCKQLIEKSGLKGLKTTDRKSKDLFASYQLEPTPDEGDAPPANGLAGLEAVVTDIEFDENDPLSIRFENGSAVLSLRARFKPAGQDLLPPLEVEIPFKAELTRENIVVTAGKVRVTSRDPAGASETFGLASGLISSAISASLKTLSFSRTLPTQLWPVETSVPRIVELTTDAGWLTISAE